MTDERGFARVVDVEQVTVEIQVLVLAELDSCITRFDCEGARWEIHLGKNCKGRKRDFGKAFSHEAAIVDDNLLDLRMGWLVPMRRDSRHGERL